MTPNFLIIVLDAVRAENLSCYGHARNTTPTIDSIAEDGIRFDRAVSPASVTLDSVTSMLSGEYPGAHQSGRLGKMNTSSPILPEKLSTAGYTTGMVTCNPFLTPAFGFSADTFHPITHRFSSGLNLRKFFSEHKDLSRPLRYYQFIKQSFGQNLLASIGNALQFKYGLFEGSDDGAAKATEQSIDFIKKTSEPWWLYLHYTETHMNSIGDLPYAIPEIDKFRFLDIKPNDISGIQTTGGEVNYDTRSKETHERLYDGAIRYLDGMIATIRKALKDEGMWDETLIIITADHGELIGEHGHLGHGELYEPGIHVPLIIKPIEDQDVSVVSQRVNTLWLFDTILATANIKSKNQVANNLLNPKELAASDILSQDYTATWDWSRYNSTGEGLHAFYHDEKKLISGQNRTELYDLRTDPDEIDNIAFENNEILQDMEHRLEEKLDRIKQPTIDQSKVNFNDTTQKRLKDLGYLE